MKKIIIKITSLVLFFGLCITVNSCKKSKTGVDSNSENNSIENGISSLRIINGLGNVKYKSNFQMLEFENIEQFKSALNKLNTDAANFQYDKGNTQMLLQNLNACNVASFNNDDVEEDDDNTSDIPQNVIKLLRRSSPLSDTVLLTFLRKNFAPNKVKRVLLKNIDFSYRVSEYYRTMNLPENIRQIIDPKRIDHVPYSPGLDDFEKLFPNFVSFRNYVNEQERLFLVGGGLPESPANPKNTIGNLMETEGTLYNQYKEVKIGDDVLKRMNGKNILIRNATISTINFIRQNNRLPRYTPPASEPLNGIPASEAQPIVSPDIIVQSTDQINNNCGSVEVLPSPSFEGRVSYSTNIGGTASEGYSYYWQFGDGFVSYQRNPTHRFVGQEGIYTVSVTVYDSFGTPCGGSFSGGSSGNSTGGGNNACGEINVGTIDPTTIAWQGTINYWVGNITSYNTSSPQIYMSINWGDGSPVENYFVNNQGWHSKAHNYPINVFTTYNASITFNYQNSCVKTANFQVKFQNSSSGSGNPSCSSSDKEKDKWTTNLDNDLRISHKLKLSNTFGLGGRFDADLKTYHKIQNFFGGTWVSINANGCVDLTGNFFQPCTNVATSQACNGTSQPLSPGATCATWWHKNCYWNAGGCYYYILTNGVSSSASAWGLSSTLSIGD